VSNIQAALAAHAEARPALDDVLPLVYRELHRSAQRALSARPSDTLSATALVNELYLKLAGNEQATWRDRAHFLAVAAVTMRHVLVDHARRRTAGKRGGARRAVTLDEGVIAAQADAASLLDLHDALDRLAALDERLARVVECRFFGGMSEQETAEALGVTERTVRRDWVKARALLQHALGDARGDP
jgi:RNA polymerase sigma factor (TIGR02999 family)